jgi:ankyrin repeat protein
MNSRAIILIFVSIFIGSSLLTCAQSSLDFNKEFEQTAQLIVMLNADYDGTPEFGAGVIFGSEKDHLLIITAYHILHRGSQQPKNIWVRIKALPNKSLKATLLKHVTQGDLDLAVLSVEDLINQGVNGCAFPFDRLPTNTDLKFGDAVLPVGNPNGVSWAIPVKPDNISQINGSEIVFQSTFISSGHSGGALIDTEAKLIGMIIADQPPFGRAINLDAVLQQVKQWGYPVRLAAYYPPGPGPSPLHIAAMNGDLSKIKNLLAQCNNPNEVDEFYVTPLHLAAAWGKIDAMSLLLKAGASLNVQNIEGDFPLHSAVDSIRSVKFLCNAGANINAKNYAGKTALHKAADDNKQETVLFLIYAGADVNMQDNEKNTALHYAVSNGNIVIVKALFNAKANISLENLRNETPLWLAVEYESVEIINLLVEAGANVNNINSFNVSALQIAVPQCKNIETLRALLKSGANVNVRDENGNTPLHVAVLRRGELSTLLEIITALLKGGADVNAKNSQGNTPLLRAKHYLTGDGETVESSERFKAIESLLRQYGGK